jgi:hypothetical protein
VAVMCRTTAWAFSRDLFQLRDIIPGAGSAPARKIRKFSIAAESHIGLV